MTWTPTSPAYEEARRDPTARYATPEALLASTELSRPEKIDLLRRWYKRAIEAGGDGRGPDGEGLLSTRVARCLHLAFQDDGGDEAEPPRH